MLDQKILHHFIHDIKLGTACFVNDNPVTALESPIQIFPDFDLNCLESMALGCGMRLCFFRVGAFLFHGVFLCWL